MSNLFQKIKTSVRPAEKSAAPRLTLAAFGKHPGWDDHLPGIGVETDALALVKQTLYVSGVGKQIDSGAWEKLEPEKRIEGFDHMFLWSRPGHVLLGEMWSSTDGKGRAKYPMVLCVDGEGVAPDCLLSKVQPEVERLRAACKTAVSAEQVTTQCRMAQEQLRNNLTPGDLSPTESGPTLEARRQFLEHREFMPGRLGLMRVLHELAGTGNRCRNLRVPLGSDSHAAAMLLWCEFLKQVVSGSPPVLLVGHRGADWLDVLIGEPDGTDFFCLQAALKAVPLTTEIPYDLPPELQQRWNEVEARFLGIAAPTKNAGAPRISTPGGAGVENFDRPVAASPGNRKWLQPVIAGTVLLVGIAGYLLFHSSLKTKAKSPEPAPAVVVKPDIKPESKPEAKPVPPLVEANPKTNVAVVIPPKVATESPVAGLAQQKYDAAIAEARAAFGKQNFAEAIAKADVALGLKPEDAAALNLKREVSARQQELAVVQASAQKQYAQALETGRNAYAKNDFTAAIAQADIALGIKTNDPVAAKLRAEAKSQLDLAAIAAGELQSKYEAAMKAASAAFLAKDYAGAITQAEAALLNKAGDAAATKLKNDVQKAQAEIAAQAEREKKYKAAIAAGQKAYDGKDYAGAIMQADVALTNKPGDVVAMKLKGDAQAQQAEIVAQAERDQRYKAAMSAGQSAYDRKDYAEAIKQADAALLSKAGDADAAGLKKKSADDKDLQEAQASIGRGELDKARSLCAAHVGTPAFDELAKQIVEKASDKFDTDLEVFQVRFGRLDPKKAKTPEARKETQWLGELSNPLKEQCQRDVEVLRENFKAAGRLDADHEKKLSELKKAVDQHL